MTVLNWFRDYLWVLQAYLRGKVLRQKYYRPQTSVYFNIPPTTNATTKRMVLLIRWWGLRPATFGDMGRLIIAEVPNISNIRRRLLYIKNRDKNNRLLPVQK